MLWASRYNMASSNCVILSEDVKPLMSQVAGHAHDKDKSTPGKRSMDMHGTLQLLTSNTSVCIV